jgi:hypothetical protein
MEPVVMLLVFFFLKIIDIKFINYDRLFAFFKNSLFDTNTYVTFNLGFYY